MAKQKEYAAVLDRPETRPKRNFRFQLQGKWLYHAVVLEGVEDEKAARAELHRMLDQAIVQVIPERS